LKPGEVVGKSIYDFYANVPQILECVEKALDGETVKAKIQVEDTHWAAYYYPTCNPKGHITGVTSVAFNISKEHERIRRQEVLMDIATLMRSINTRKEMPAKILEKVLDLFQAQGAMILSHPPSNHVLTLEEFVRKGDVQMGRPVELGDYPWLVDRSEQIIANGQPYLDDQPQEPLPLVQGMLSVAGVPISTRDERVGVIWVFREQPLTPLEVTLLTEVGEITGISFQRAEQYDQTQRRLHRLSALHAIDQAITGTFDLNVTLNVILDQVITQLDVDAADIFLYKPKTHALEFGEGRGFKHTDSSHQQVRERVGLVWQVARERALVNIPNLPQRTQMFVRRSLIEEEKFITYFGIPLIAKGEIKGVLEVFHREALQIDSEWVNFLKTLANQAAIAIDNAALFENLRKSNMKLDLAYHSTLEGWVRALDLRDEEGQGHTKRVTQRTLRLAKAMGINGEELVHIRRGALLHDIGKLAISDDILNKKGSLTEEEWEQIKKHPLYAQEMLSEI
jgi:GAF domain-containing protein